MSISIETKITFGHLKTPSKNRYAQLMMSNIPVLEHNCDEESINTLLLLSLAGMQARITSSFFLCIQGHY